MEQLDYNLLYANVAKSIVNALLIDELESTDGDVLWIAAGAADVQ
jgi:hypothetical protein